MSWMAQGRTMAQALVLSPTRSPLLTSISRPQETTFSNQSPVTPGQGQRLQIAETVRLETFEIVIISLFAETTEAKTLEILTTITAFTFFHSFSLEVKFKLTEFGHWNKLNVHEQASKDVLSLQFQSSLLQNTMDLNNHLQKYLLASKPL